MVFVTLFTRLENVHLLKDVGLIPYFLCRDYGYACTMVTKKNEKEYPYLKREVKGLSIRFIRGKGAWYLIRNARRIDILNVYHLNLQSFVNLLIYRVMRKKGGRSYLKLDMDEAGLERLLKPDPVGFIKRRTMELADVASVETKRIYRVLRKKYGSRILYLPNGYFGGGDEPQGGFHKENVILTVGELGTEPKATDVLIKAFVKAAGDRTDWTLKLVGPVAEGFRNPYPEDPRIIFTGRIRDKDKLNGLYRQAKVFAFPSRHESFGIAMLEAQAAGDYLVSTEGVPAAKDIIGLTKAGRIVGVDDTNALAGALKSLMDSGRDWDAEAVRIAAAVHESFRWEKLVPKLEERLEALTWSPS